MTETLTASKTEQVEDAGSKAWWAKSRPEDTELRRFAEAAEGGLTLQARLDCLWEGLLVAGVATCPVCGDRMERSHEVARCAGCASTLS